MGPEQTQRKQLFARVEAGESNRAGEDNERKKVAAISSPTDTGGGIAHRG